MEGASFDDVEEGIRLVENAEQVHFFLVVSTEIQHRQVFVVNNKQKQILNQHKEDLVHFHYK